MGELFHKNSHQRSAVPPASQAVTRRPPPAADTSKQMNLVPELKPSVLPNDALAWELHIWINKFEAYYQASGMQHARTVVQHAYLLNCLDSTLSLQLDGGITAQTLVLGANSRMSKLVQMFRKKYLLLLRRKNFFQISQQAGQDVFPFLGQLKCAASEADIEGMTLEDALFLTLLSGVHDDRLKEKLSELDPPTLPAFGVLIDAHLHSKATTGQAAAANGTKGKSQQQKNKNTAPKITDTEKKRRQVMKGKCFRCGSPVHMANNCKEAKDVKCRLCNAQGHIQNDCGKGKACSAYESLPNGNKTLALDYQQPQSSEYANVIRIANQ